MRLFLGMSPDQCLQCFRQPARAIAISAVLMAAWFTETSTYASLVSFPVTSPQGTITQAQDGSTVNTVTFGAINIGNGTFALSTATPSFGIGLNPTAAPQNQWFFTQANNNVAWLVSGGEVPILTSGTTVGSGGSFASLDPFFASVWRNGVLSGYAGLRLQSGSDYYYGYATIDYVVGSPNQATVSSFAFENVVNTPVVVPEPSMTLPAAACAVALAAFRHRRTRTLPACTH